MLVFTLMKRFSANLNCVLRTMSLPLLLAFATPSVALDEINTTRFGNLAIKGYDAVAYFTEAQAIKGNEAFRYEWKGANWQFSSAENLALFKANPEKFAPQYGGYCAYAVAKNSTASIDPTQFTIVDNKLYLNYNQRINKKWLADRDNFIAVADVNWPALLGQ